jgi:hypothetical protein
VLILPQFSAVLFAYLVTFSIPPGQTLVYITGMPKFAMAHYLAR